MAEAFDLTVTRLIRVAYGPFSLKGLGPGDAKRVAHVPRWLVAKAHAAAAEPPSARPSVLSQRRVYARPRSRKPAKPRTTWEGATPGGGGA